jgi:hypothetical protein
MAIYMNDFQNINNTDSKFYGMVATFYDVPAVYQVAQKIRDAGFKKWDVYAPLPIHGLDKAMGIKRSKVPIFTLLGGLSGFLTGVIMVWYMNAYDYPLIVGGKPLFSPIFPFPIFYELTILLAAFGTFFGMFITNRLPQHYHPVFNHETFQKASDDTFFVLIQKIDPLFNPYQTAELLKSLGGANISMVEE